MVVISNVRNMFWGVTIDAGKRYSQTVTQGFHLSMAALEPGSGSKEHIQVMVHHGSSEFLLCSLHPDNLLQQHLDLVFGAGEELAFSLTGKGVVHLTGYLLEDEPQDFDDYSAEEESDEESDAPQLIEMDADQLKAGTKRKAITAPSVVKKSKIAADDDDDDDDDDDEDFSEDDFSFDEDDSSLGGSDDEEEDSEDDEDDSEDDEDEDNEEKEAMPSPPKKKAAATPKGGDATPKENYAGSSKKAKKDKTPIKETKGISPKADEKAPETPNTPANGESAKKKKKKKKNKNKEGNDSMNKSSTQLSEKSLTDSTPAAPKNRKGQQEGNPKQQTPKGQTPKGQTPKSQKEGTPKGQKERTPKADQSAKRRVVAGGTVIEDIKIGNGPVATAGKMVGVYYNGVLSNSNKQFDSCSSGKPFRFRLKHGEVIKGWDNGVEGMKVGGKRKILVPANQAYGNVRQGPIPANSALTFEVELKAVS